MKLHAESPVLHAESSCILHAKEFLLYFKWPLIVTLLRVNLATYLIYPYLACLTRPPQPDLPDLT